MRANRVRRPLAEPDRLVRIRKQVGERTNMFPLYAKRLELASQLTTA